MTLLPKTISKRISDLAKHKSIYMYGDVSKNCDVCKRKNKRLQIVIFTSLKTSFLCPVCVDRLLEVLPVREESK